MNLTEMLKRRAKLVKDARALIATIDDKTSDEDKSAIEKRAEAMLVEVDELQKGITREERLAGLEAQEVVATQQREERAAADAAAAAAAAAADPGGSQAGRQDGTQKLVNLGMAAGDVRKYSILRAVRAAMSGNWEPAGFEAECSRACSDVLGRAGRPNGFFVPNEVFAHRGMERRREIEHRVTLTTGGVGTGAELVGTDHLGREFIQALYPNTLAFMLGARALTGLVGNVDIPGNGAVSFAWVAEDTAPTSDDATTRSILLAPKTIAGFQSVSRRLMLQSDPSVDAMLMDDLIMGASVAIDAAVFEGTGASNDPIGVQNAAGVNEVTVVGADPTFAETIEFETAVETGNALNGGLAYVTTPAEKAVFKQTPIDAGSGIMQWAKGELNGYPVFSTNQVSGIMFGDWSQIMIAFWGAVELVVDTATKAPTGGTVLRIFQDADIGIRQPVAFARKL